jgi:hypothetical protein
MPSSANAFQAKLGPNAFQGTIGPNAVLCECLSSQNIYLKIMPKIN